MLILSVGIQLLLITARGIEKKVRNTTSLETWKQSLDWKQKRAILNLVKNNITQNSRRNK